MSSSDSALTETKLMHGKLSQNDDAGFLELLYAPTIHFHVIKLPPSVVIDRAKGSNVPFHVVLVFDCCGDAVKGTDRQPLLVP